MRASAATVEPTETVARPVMKEATPTPPPPAPRIVPPPVETTPQPRDVPLFALDEIDVPDVSALPTPAVDTELVDAYIGHEERERIIVEHHSQVFHTTFSSASSDIDTGLRFMQPYVQQLEERVQRESERLSELPSHRMHKVKDAPHVPWTASAMVTATFSFLFAVALLAIGVNTLATFLIGSGYIVFVERPELAYILSCVNVGIAMVLKVGATWISNSEAGRRRYFLALWSIGLVSGLVWMVLFARLFPNMGSDGLTGIIQQLGTVGGTQVLERWFVGSQLVAEVCLAAALWLHVEKLIDEHGPAVKSVRDPEHLAQECQLNDAMAHQVKAERIVGRLRAAQDAIVSRERIYLTRVRAEITSRRAAYLEQLAHSNGRG